MTPENIVPFPDTNKSTTQSNEANPREPEQTQDAELIELPATVHTPETDRECVDLANAIDEQLERWMGYINYSRRGMHIDIASHIVEDCSALEHEPIDYLPQANFGGAMTREDAVLKTRYEERRVLLAEWVQDPDLDNAHPTHNLIALSEYLDDVIKYCEQAQVLTNGETRRARYDTFITAARNLRRMLIVREQLMSSTHKIRPPDTHLFIQLALQLNNDAL